jgi:hypothetical protein
MDLSAASPIRDFCARWVAPPRGENFTTLMPVSER